MLFSTYFRGLSAAKKIALIAVFAALSIAVNYFSIDVTASNKIAFTYVVCFFAGWMLGGVPAFCIAFAGDAVGYLINPSGVYFLFGATLGVYALLMGVILNARRKDAAPHAAAPYIRAAVALAVGYLMVTVILNTAVNYWYALLFLWEGVAKKTFWVYFAGRIAFQSIVYAANTAICIVLVPLLVQIGKKYEKRRKQTDAVRGQP